MRTVDILFWCSITAIISQREDRLDDETLQFSQGRWWSSPHPLQTLANMLMVSFSVPSSVSMRHGIPMLADEERYRRLVSLRGGSSSEDEERMPGLRFLGDAKLMQVQPPVAESEIETGAFQDMLSTLRDAMEHYGGIGIAAPQIGFWTRVFVFGIIGTNSRYPAADEIPFQVWINPQIVWSSPELNWMWEGCLSVPGIRGWVGRPRAVRLRGFDEHGTEKEVDLEGLPARIAQHELDHLDGILFPRRTPGIEFLVPQSSMDEQERWAEGWPSTGARKTSRGELSDEM